VVVKRGETVTRVLGDPDHHVSRGALCGKCAIAYNGAWRDPKARLVTPLRRIGPKGSARFEPLGWDEALSLVAQRLNRTIEIHGGSSVLHSHYTGTCSLIAGWFPMRLLNRMGCTEVDPDTVCNKAGHTALEAMFGDSGLGFDPRTATDARCILVWGANPSASAPHQHQHWLPEAGALRIVIDPIRHETAAKADIHLQPRPGTDAALAFAMLHVLVREKLVDRRFLRASVSGWDEVERQLPACTPDWAEAVTGVPSALLEEAAVAYGRGPSLLWLGQGLQRQATGGNVFRSCALLPVATGMLGKPGTGLLYMNGTGSRGIYMDYLTGAHLRPADAKSAVSHMDLAAHLSDREATKAFLTWNNNVAASSPRQADLRRALADESLFHVAIDLFHTDTTAYADVVLPAASFLEFDDLLLSYFHYSVSAQVRAQAPLGDALPNQEIFRRLAAAMGLDDPELFERDEDMLARLLRQTGLGLDFATLAERGTVPYRSWPLIPFTGGRFPTPSGKVEITAERFVEAGLPRVPQPLADLPPANGRLRVLSPASPWLMNSSYGNDPRIRQLQGAPSVGLNPGEATRRDLLDGDDVELRNETGRLGPLKVRLDPGVPPGVALVPKGRWPGLDRGGANVNALNPGAKTDLAESSAVHGVEAELHPLRPRPADSFQSTEGRPIFAGIPAE
jgi:anaerobic selenocysteine-containing dehydrogenase